MTSPCLIYIGGIDSINKLEIIFHFDPENIRSFKQKDLFTIVGFFSGCGASICSKISSSTLK